MTLMSRARLFPFIIFSLGVLAVLKLTNIWIGFAPANAEAVTAVAADADTETVNQLTSDTALELASEQTVRQGEVERRILEKLSEKRAALDAREKEIEVREALLAVAERQIEAQISKLEVERAAFQAILDENAQAESEDIESLVSAYERMKPRDAAAIFNDLDEDILIPVAAGMRTQALAGALAEMQPEKARYLTKRLAERNAVEPASSTEVQ